jgi:hypothetical protein
MTIPTPFEQDEEPHLDGYYQKSVDDQHDCAHCPRTHNIEQTGSVEQ